MKINVLENRTKKILELHIKRQARALFSEYSEKNLLNQLIVQPNNTNPISSIDNTHEVYRLFSEFLSMPEENLFVYPSKISFKASMIPEYRFNIHRQPNKKDVFMSFTYSINEVKWIGT